MAHDGGEFRDFQQPVKLRFFRAGHKISGGRQLHPQRRILHGQRAVGGDHAFHRGEQPLFAGAMGQEQDLDDLRIVPGIFQSGHAGGFTGEQFFARGKTGAAARQNRLRKIRARIGDAVADDTDAAHVVTRQHDA